MADENDDQQLEALKQAREAQKRADKRAKEEADRAAAAETELTEVKAQIRQDALEGIIAKVGGPAGLLNFYPADKEVSEEAVAKFITEDLGVELKPKKEDWAAYEKMQKETAVQQPNEDPLEEMARKNIEAIEASMNFYAPESEAGESLKALKEAAKVTADYEKTRNKNEQVIPVGYGGRFDPPDWAQTAESFHR